MILMRFSLCVCMLTAGHKHVWCSGVSSSRAPDMPSMLPVSFRVQDRVPLPGFPLKNGLGLMQRHCLEV